MHNITRIVPINSCYMCHDDGFFTLTPDGGDYCTCGVCGSGCGLDYDYGVLNEMKLSRKEFEKKVRKTSDNNHLLDYCTNCRILTFIGCTHGENGCTDGVYNTHFISEWIDKRTGEKFVGMPQFDDNQDWFDHVSDVQILKYYCPNNGSHCSSASYSVLEHPNYYEECCEKNT